MPCGPSASLGRPSVRRSYSSPCFRNAADGLATARWRASDVDLEHGVIQINKAIDREAGEVKSTKSGEARRIPIEAALRRVGSATESLLECVRGLAILGKLGLPEWGPRRCCWTNASRSPRA